MDSINDQHEPPTSMMGPSGTALEREAREYVAEVLAEVRAPRLPAASEVHRDTPALAHSVFAVLTHRRFCSLSRRRTDQYRDAVVAALERRAADGGAFRFFLDIG